MKNIQKSICVIGASNIDIVGEASFAKKGDSVVGSVRQTMGGVGRNIAEVLSRLDFNVSFLSVCARDISGQMLINHLREHKLDNYLKIVEGMHSGTYLALLENGEMQYAINDMAIVEQIDDVYINTHSSIIKNAPLCIVDANLSPLALESIFKLNHANIFAEGVSMVKVIKFKPYLDKICGIKVNALEAYALTNIKIHDIKSARACIDYLHKKGVKKIVITMGEEGVIASDGNHIISLKIESNKIKNTTGAGDAFIAVWCAAQQMGLPFIDGLKYASIGSKMTIESCDTVSDAIGIHFFNKQLSEEEFDEQIYRHIT